ncbi:MAG: hypothetical protein V2A34_15780 [Lentisphaerota bacterium]
MNFGQSKSQVLEMRTRDDSMPVKCCSCHRIRVDGHWMAAAAHTSSHALYSHGYCPSCYTSAMAQLSLCRVATH